MFGKLENSEILENETEKLIINGEQIIIGPNWCLITVLEDVKNYKMRRNSKEPKHCTLCGTPFHFGISKRTICLCRFFLNCATCSNQYEKVELSKSVKEAIINGERVTGYCCNKCQSTAIYKLTLGKTLKEDPERYASWCKLGGDASVKWAEENPELAYERNKKGGDASAKWFNEHPELKHQRNVNAGKATQEFYKEHPEILYQNALNWQAGSVKAHLENGEEWNKNIGKGLKRAYQNDPTLAEAKIKILREYWSREENKPRLILNLGPWANGGIVNLRFCPKCNEETPHTMETNECRCCNGELMWCEECQRFGKVGIHKNPEHNTYYKDITYRWIKEHPEELEAINWTLIDVEGNRLDDFNQLPEEKPCIYGWFVKIPEVDDKLNLETTEVPIYIGQSRFINSRILDHLCRISKSPEYYAYKKEIGIELRILEEFDDSNLTNEQIKLELDVAELNWIDKLKPWSQKCSGTDNIKPLSKRDSLPWMD